MVHLLSFALAAFAANSALAAPLINTVDFETASTASSTASSSSESVSWGIPIIPTRSTTTVPITTTLSSSPISSSSTTEISGVSWGIPIVPSYSTSSAATTTPSPPPVRIAPPHAKSSGGLLHGRAVMAPRSYIQWSSRKHPEVPPPLARSNVQLSPPKYQVPPPVSRAGRVPRDTASPSA
ncbi:hypothetical protein BD413DRAFT_557194 [Trametes elegans]|nr:hypothetical protein BD413DRAFT_557194 [Trametes elegans]